MEIHRRELKYSLVLIDASAEHGGITHVRGKCDCGYGITTIMDRNRKSISDSELRRFMRQLTLHTAVDAAPRTHLLDQARALTGRRDEGGLFVKSSDRSAFALRRGYEIL